MNKSERERMLAETPIVRLFIKLAIPAIIGMLVQALYNVVDRYFIGNIPVTGKIAIGGIGVALPILFILMGFSMLYGIGGGANISIKLGQQDKAGAEKVLANAIAMLVLTGLVLNISFLVFSEPLLKLFGATEQNLPYALTYLRIILVGNFWNNLAFAFNHLTRAEGNAKRAMISMLIGAISNIILDALFIGVLHWGVAGAAYATIIAQFLSFLWGAIYYINKQSLVEFHFKNMVPNAKIVTMIIAIGFSPFFIQIAGSLIGAILNNALKLHGGTLAQGAYAIINSVAMLFFMPVFGMNQALQPIIGYNYGAGDYQRVKRANNVGIIAATSIMIVGWLCIQFLTYPMIAVMADDKQLIELTVAGIRGFLLMMPLIGMQIINTNFFQSIGQAKIAFLLSLSRQVLLLIPLLLIMPGIWGLNGIWYAPPISDTLAFALSLFFMIRAYRRWADK